MGGARGIRNDRLRRLVREARRQGWHDEIDGRGHLRVVGPEGKAFTVSLTVNNSKMGHDYENCRADARRAGLDVSGL